ncbi:MAG TPA: hypothetical protein VEY13_10590 [Rubrobacteraceae bacterium]|jgi:hypothetical protein|nr:hypothetical protein [Rubrobacteraceae bacterium]
MTLTQAVQSIKEMDRKDLEAAIPRLREEVIEAEEALKVAQARLREANGRLAKVSSYVEVQGDHLLLNVKTRDRKLMLVSSMKIPLEHVVRAEADPNVDWEVWRGCRIQGVKVPGVQFYAMHGRRDKTLVIWLEHESCERLITEVEDPVEVAKTINEAVGVLSTTHSL